MNNMELTIDEGEYVKINAYMNVNGKWIRKTISVWYEKEEYENGLGVSISIQSDKDNEKNDVCLMISPKGLCIQKDKSVKVADFEDECSDVE